MDALLIVGGCFLLACGWLALAITARQLSIVRFVLALFLAPLLIPLRGRGYSLWPRLLMLSGLVAVIAGLGLLHQQQPQRFDHLVSAGWLSGQGGATRDVQLQGRLLGRDFRPDSASWLDGDLLLEQRDSHRVIASLRVRFSDLALGPADGLTWLPGDSGPWPALVMQWHQGALSAPGWKRFDQPYTLTLTQDGNGWLSLALRLPAAEQTWLSGRVRLDTGVPWAGLATAVAAENASSVEPPTATPPVQDASSSEAWQPVSLIDLYETPSRYLGRPAQLLTWSGRTHAGHLQGISEDQRLVLLQRQDANRIELHFHPQDIERLELRPLK